MEEETRLQILASEELNPNFAGSLLTSNSTSLRLWVIILETELSSCGVKEAFPVASTRYQLIYHSTSFLFLPLLNIVSWSQCLHRY